MGFPKVLCSLTTFSQKGFSYDEKLEEVKTLRLPEFAVFLTGLKGRQRYAFYSKLLSLRENHEFQIPFVHATSEMTDDDYSFFVREFNTEAFNIHPISELPLAYPLSPISKNKIFIENTLSNEKIPKDSDLEGFGGLCLDLSHTEESISEDKNLFYNFQNLISKYKVGANHISAVPIPTNDNISRSKHHFTHITDFDYLYNYQPEFFGRFAAIELEDPISVQLAIKPRIEKIISTCFSEERLRLRA